MSKQWINHGQLRGLLELRSKQIDDLEKSIEKHRAIRRSYDKQVEKAQKAREVAFKLRKISRRKKQK